MSEVKKTGKAAPKKEAPARKPAAKPKAAQAKRDGAAKKPPTKPKAAQAKRDGAAKKPPAKPKAAPKRAAPAKKAATAKKPASAKPRRVAPEKPARAAKGDLFLENRVRPKKKTAAKKPTRRQSGLFGVLNACLAIGIAVLVAVGVRQQSSYAEFLQMRDAVDKQTFYEGTTVEGVDVSNMTLSDALDYWRERVEPRYANRAATLDDGTTVTAGQLGYSSDYEAVLNAAWSAGRSGPLERRYQMVSYRRENPVAYAVTRSDYDPDALAQFAENLASAVDRPAVDASIDSFDTENYAFVFREAVPGVSLDTDALARDVGEAIAAGGGGVTMRLTALQPAVSTEEVESRYGLIDYAITNASASSKARLNNIKLALETLNGTRVAPGETFSFNDAVGKRTTARGYRKATAYSGGEVTEEVGGGICQVSTTLFNAAVKADMEIVERHNHSLTVSYVDKGKDATVSWDSQDFRFRNTSPDDIIICCYLTDDKRVRFGIFGRLLPNGEKITLDAVTTEVIKYETVYEPTPLLPKGETYVSQNGRNGYKAEAYKVRWDAEGNRISRELMFKSTYKVKNEIVQYGA